MSDRTPIPVVGIVGGIGSGKSSVARWVATHHPEFVLINGDEAGHEVLRQPTVRDAVIRRFGPGVRDADGEIDRRALGRVVFGSNDEEQVARRDLERIVHPRIREAFERRIAQAAAEGKQAVLLDAAVLFEAGWNDLCHAVVFVDVPRSQRLERLRVGRGWDEMEVERRESSQIPLETKRQRSGFLVDNARTIEEAGRQLERVLPRINAQASSDPTRS